MVLCKHCHYSIIFLCFLESCSNTFDSVVQLVTQTEDMHGRIL